jgi:glucose/arabinose dehydrogenase
VAPRPLWRMVLPCATVVITALAAVGYAGAAPAITATDYEAENATISQGVAESNHAGFSGTGFVNYDNLTGSYVEWTVTSATAGPADLILRYANGTTANRAMDVTVNGTLVAGGLAFNGTGAWTTWQTQTIRAPLPAGPAKIRATATTANGGPSADKLTVSAADDLTTGQAVAGGPAGVPNPGTVTTIASGVDVAWGEAFLPDGSALFSERNTFNIYRLTGSGTKTPAGKINQAVGTGGEGGLLGLEVSPAFATDHWVYVYHTAAEGNRVIRIKYENNTLVQSTYQILIQGIGKSRYHNGGRLRFGPDGKLYASAGDAQNTSTAQSNTSLNGKILRINPDGTIPSDNPFGNAVWSKGHRNPQGLDFDAQGRLWASEFGNTSQDEVNLITKGGNYGWPSCEGTLGSCAGFIAPKKTWSTSEASPSGLTIINNYVFVATTVGQRVYRMRIDASANLVEQATYFQGTYNRLRTVEVDQQGDIWLTTTTDKDGIANNDRILHVDIVYSP